ncbi:MAG: MMPL family transporter [bacterium]
MRKLIMRLVRFSIDYPKTVVALSVLLTVLFTAQFMKIKIDTDPENMLKADEPVRIFHQKVKKEFGIKELIVLGIVKDGGIFNPDSLEKIKRITDEILKIKGVIANDVLSITVTNNVVSRDGTLNVRPPMAEVPKTNDELEKLKREILDNPMFKDRLISSDGRGAAIYVPVESKDIAHEVGEKIKAVYVKEKGAEKYYMAGLPLAEDTFGYEMFMQMGIFAPLAGVFLMVVFFIIFKRFSLVIPPMMVAMFSVIWTMGALIGSGFTVHIMSSMIPVFLMPIAICGAVHILSDFYERLPVVKDRKQAVIEVYEELVKPLFFAPITTAVGFADLAIAPIPPVKVFGLFIALGIIISWLLSMTFLPGLMMLIKEKKPIEKEEVGSRILAGIGKFSLNKSMAVTVFGVVLLAVSVYGINLLVVNDNPVKWFKKHHPIRVADRELNKVIGGTYISYLVLEGNNEDDIKRPEVMRYIENTQKYLGANKLVGKTTSVADIVKRTNYVLHDENKEYDALPDEKDAIGQYLFLVLSSSSPDELDNFVDYNFKNANIWVQLKSGDNRDMSSVVQDVENYVKSNPLPEGVRMEWSGLPYLNIKWQNLMVSGMLEATLGTWWIVLVFMALQFRSIWWGLVGMAPLGFSVAFSYGLMGLVGKEYDMPIAVCSTLAIGLGDDFAIHFISRFRERFEKLKDLKSAMQWTMGGEPALAIFRNAVIIGVGFTPMAIASLTPYVTVGLFFGSLAFFSGIITLVFLPALIGTFRKVLLGSVKQ